MKRAYVVRSRTERHRLAEWGRRNGIVVLSPGMGLPGHRFDRVYVAVDWDEYHGSAVHRQMCQGWLDVDVKCRMAPGAVLVPGIESEEEIP